MKERHITAKSSRLYPQALHLKPEGRLPSVYVVERAADPALISPRHLHIEMMFLPGMSSLKNYSYTYIFLKMFIHIQKT